MANFNSTTFWRDIPNSDLLIEDSEYPIAEGLVERLRFLAPPPVALKPDVELLTNERTYKVSTLLMGQISDFFRRMHDNPMVERITGVVDLRKGTLSDAVVEKVVKHAYGHPITINENEIKTMIEVSDFLMSSSLDTLIANKLELFIFSMEVEKRVEFCDFLFDKAPNLTVSKQWVANELQSLICAYLTRRSCSISETEKKVTVIETIASFFKKWRTPLQVDFSFSRTGFHELTFLAPPINLTHLNLSHCPEIDDSGFRNIKFFPLHQLNISNNPQLTRQSALGISETKTLKKLLISHCPKFGVSGLKQLEKLPLDQLDVSCNKWVSNNAVEFIATFFKLKTLNLDSCCKVTARGISHLENLPLRELRISQIKFQTLEEIRPLLVMSALEKLRIDSIVVGHNLLMRLPLKELDLSLNREIKSLAQSKTLRRLNLSFCANIPDSELSELPRIEWLSLRSTSFSDAIGPRLSSYVQLRTLDLGCTRNLTDEILEWLPKSITDLTLGPYSLFTADGIKTLKALTSLQRLSISDCHLIDDRAMGYIARLPITTLEANKLPKWRDFQPLSTSRSMRRLSMQSCPNIDITSLPSIQSMQLEQLDISQNEWAGDEAKSYIKQCRSILLLFC